QSGRWSKDDPSSNKFRKKWKANPARTIKMARRRRVRSRDDISSVNPGPELAARRQRTCCEQEPWAPSRDGSAKCRFGKPLRRPLGSLMVCSMLSEPNTPARASPSLACRARRRAVAHLAALIAFASRCLLPRLGRDWETHVAEAPGCDLDLLRLGH